MPRAQVDEEQQGVSLAGLVQGPGLRTRDSAGQPGSQRDPLSLKHNGRVP